MGYIHSLESTKVLLPVASLAVSLVAKKTNGLVRCDSASSHSWVTVDLVKLLHLVDTPDNLIRKTFNSTSLMKTHKVIFQVSPKRVIVNCRFLFELMLKITRK